MKKSSNEVLITNIPNEYELMINCIQHDVISKLYSKINFKYLLINNIDFGQKIIDKYDNHIFYDDDAKNIFSSINNNFSTIEITNFKPDDKFAKKINKNFDPNSSTQIVNVIICNEFNCTIIEGIRYNVIKELITELKKQNASIINITHFFPKELKSKEEIFAEEEVQSFRSTYSNEIKNNKFVDYTISSIICYMIRRFLYPREYFFDKTFFDFASNNVNEYFDSFFFASI